MYRMICNIIRGQCERPQMCYFINAAFAHWSQENQRLESRETKRRELMSRGQSGEEHRRKGEGQKEKRSRQEEAM